MLTLFYSYLCTAAFFAQMIKTNKGGGTDLKVEVQITCERSEQKKIDLLYAELALGRPQI